MRVGKNPDSWRWPAWIAIAIAGIGVAGATSLLLRVREAEARASEGRKLALAMVAPQASDGDVVAKVRAYVATQGGSPEARELASIYRALAARETELRTALADLERAMQLYNRPGPLWAGRDLDIAEVNLRTGETKTALGDTAGAMAAFNAAIESAAKSGAGDIAARRVTAAAHERLAARYRHAYDMRRASEHAQQAISIYEAMPADAAARQALMNSFVTQAGILSRQNRLYEAHDLYIRVLDERMQAAAEHPDSVAALTDLALAHSGVGQILGGTIMSMGEDDAAVRQYREAIAIAERLAKENPQSAAAESLLAQQLSACGGAMRKPALAGESLRMLERAAEIHKRLLAADPGNVNHVFYLTATLGDIGARLAPAKKWKAAVESLLEAQGAIEKVLASDPANRTPKLLWLDVMHKLAPAMARAGDAAGAIRAAARGLEVAREQGALDSEVFRTRIEIPLSLNTVAETYAALGRMDEAVEAARKAVAEWARVRSLGTLPRGVAAEAEMATALSAPRTAAGVR